MDSGYIDNEFNYYKKDNFNNNLNFKLLIIILNIFFLFQNQTIYISKNITILKIKYFDLKIKF
jgi:hypothetical protein